MPDCSDDYRPARAAVLKRPGTGRLPSRHGWTWTSLARIEVKRTSKEVRAPSEARRTARKPSGAPIPKVHRPIHRPVWASVEARRLRRTHCYIMGKAGTALPRSSPEG